MCFAVSNAVLFVKPSQAGEKPGIHVFFLRKQDLHANIGWQETIRGRFALICQKRAHVLMSSRMCHVEQKLVCLCNRFLELSAKTITKFGTNGRLWEESTYDR